VTFARRRGAQSQLGAVVPALGLDLAQAEALKERARQKLAEMRLEMYEPYAKQAAFHALGKEHRERLLMAGNQLGKTYSAAAETAMHLTGIYPDWWKGRVFTKPTTGWAAGVTTEATRDTIQRLLMGPPGAYGTGLIPKASILTTTQSRGIGEALDFVVIKHRTGGRSQLSFKSYALGREKFQGATLDFVWLDEEPSDPDLYSEAVTRTNATGGCVYMTFTPLLGMSTIVRLFYPRPSTPDRALVQMTIDDAGHLDEAARNRIIASYQPHEREARARGIPMLGSGRVFTIPETQFVAPAFAIPAHWPRIGGLDFGVDHPTAGVMLAHDRDTDVVYLMDTHRLSGATINAHALALKSWGGYPMAWPHDGLVRDRGSGDTIAELYRRAGLNMLWERATFEDGNWGVEAGIAAITNRLEEGRLKVFSHLSDWLEEYRLLHRKDGKIVAENDDLIAATRYALMMLRMAGFNAAKRKGAIRRNLKGIV
jgi:phage terminase large subunit-like protein